MCEPKKGWKTNFQTLEKGVACGHTSASMRLVEHWQRKRVRVRDENVVYTQHTRTSSTALILARASIPISTIFTTFNSFLSVSSVYAWCVCVLQLFFSLFVLLSTAFCLPASISSFIFFLAHSLFCSPATFLCVFCLYNMINVCVYIVVRSKRKYIE